MKKSTGRILKVVVPALLLCSPAIASTARTISRFRGKSIAVKSSTLPVSEKSTSKSLRNDPFTSFGDTIKNHSTSKSISNGEILDFLDNNGLLKAKTEHITLLSGDINSEVLGRKEFAHTSPFSHCHTPWSTYNTNDYPGLNPTVCSTSYSGTWHTKSTEPFFEDANVSNKTTTSFDVNVDLNQSSTVYAVLVLNSATAPSSAQVKSGHDGSGASAIQHKNISVNSGAFTGTIPFTGLNSSLSYLVYLVGENGSEITPDPKVVNPAFEFGTISSTGTWKFPKVRTDNNGDFYTMYTPSSGTIQFIKWNGTSWDNYTSLTGSNVPGRTSVSYGNEYRANFDFDSNNDLQVIFNACAGACDGFHGVYNGTSWSINQVADDVNAPDETRLFIDSNDKAHMVYHVDGYGVGRNYILKYATNASGSWASQEIIETTNRGTDEIHDNYVVADTSGAVTLFYRREDVQNNRYDNYYRTSSSDSFSAQTKILDGKGLSKIFQLGNVIIDASNKIHFVYSNETDSTAHYTTNNSGSWITAPITSTTHTINRGLGIARNGTNTYILANSSSGYVFQGREDGDSWVDGNSFSLNGSYRDVFALDSVSNRIMLVSENSSDWTISYHTGVTSGYVELSTVSLDSDGTLTAGTGVTEPVNIPTTVTTGSPINVFDFKITDGGTADGLSLDVSRIDINLSGTASSNFNKLRYNLTGCATINGVAASGSTLSFTSTGISVTNGGNTTCTVQAYWNDATGITDNQNIAMSIDGDTDLTLDGAKTQMSGSNSAIATGNMGTSVAATQLVFTTQPSGSVSGSVLTIQPVIAAQDTNGNVDADVSATVTLTEGSAGTLTGNSVAASSGVATFTNLIYTAGISDGESFTLTADEPGTLATDDSNATSSDVVASKLIFTTQPAGSVSGIALTTQPVVEARSFNNIKDIDFTETITLTEASAGALSNNTQAAVSGVASFSNLIYSATADHQSFILTADEPGTLTTDTSSSTNSDVIATQLVFTTQPSPLGVESAIQRDFTTDPVVMARNAVGIIDTDFNDTVVIAETGAGSATYTNNSKAAINGIATFTGLTITYNASSVPETFAFQANDQNDGANAEGDLSPVNSSNLSADSIPPAPAALNLLDGSDSGSSNSDDITNDTTPTISGTARANTDVTITSSADGAIGTITSDGSGNWSITTTTLSSSTHSITATASNGAGTSPSSTPLSIVVDTTNATPGTPDMSSSTDTGSLDNDDITNDTTPTFSGTAETDSSVTLTSSVNGNIGTTTTDPSGNWTITAATLDATAHNISVTSVDIAGNTSSISSQLPILIDTAAPSATSLPDLTSSSDSGTSNTDDVTKDTTPTFSGTSDPLAIITLSSSVDGDRGTAAADGSGNWTITATTLSGGVHDMTAISADLAGNISSASSALSITVDTISPAFSGMPTDTTVATASITETTAIVSWAEPTATDNINGSLTPVQTGGLANNSSFPLGDTTITYTATDNQGNFSTDSFTVTVTQKQPFPWLDLIPGLVSPNKVIR